MANMQRNGIFNRNKGKLLLKVCGVKINGTQFIGHQLIKNRARKKIKKSTPEKTNAYITEH